MTDELTIQGVNPQMQQVQKKNNTVPYTLGGAAVGATAGYFINNAVQSKANWEDLVKEVKDTTDFSSKAEPATWNSLKEKANEVAKLQEQLKNLPEKTLTSGEEFEALEKAKNARNAEFERLVEIEKKKASAGTVVSMPTQEDMRLGIKGDDASKVAADYKKYNETLLPEYEAKVNAVKTDSTVAGHSDYIKAEGAKNNYETKLKKYYEDTAKNAMEKDKSVKRSTEKRLERDLEKLVNNEYKYKSDKEILEQAFKEHKMVQKKGSLSRVFVNVYKDPKTGKEYVLKDEFKFRDLRKEAKAQVDSLRAALLDDINGAESGYNDASKNLTDFANRKEFRKLSKKGNPNAEFVCNLADIQGKNTIKELEKEADIIQKLADPKKASKVKPADITAIQTKYGFNPKEIAGNKKIAEQINKRLDLAKEYKDLDKALKDALGGQERITLYKEQMEKAINSNKDVNSAANRIKALAKKYGINVEASTNIDETAIKNKVTEAIKGTHFENDLKLAQDAFDEAVKTKGTANTAAKEALEGQIKTASEALEKGAQELAGKLKTGGMNKYAAMAIGGIALALAGFGIASSKKA